MEPSSKDFLPIPIQDFIQGTKLPADVHVRLSDEKFVLVGKAGQPTVIDQFRNYKDHEVSYLWVHKKEYYKFAHQSITLAGVAIKRADLDDKQKTNLVTHAGRSIFRHIEHMGIDLDTYNSARQVTEAVMGLAETHKSLTDLFFSLAACSDQVLAHSVGVSTLSTLIGSQIGYETRATMEKLALAGLLHDIGLKALPPNLLEIPVARMSPEEHQQYETHTLKGTEMLNSLGIVPDDIVSIVYQHHENAIGQGYPQRIRDVKMHPLAKVVALADAVANLIIAGVNCPNPKTPMEAVAYIENVLGLPYNKEAFRALKRLIDKDKNALAA